MLITSLIYLLTSNAVALRRDKSILYSRWLIITLILMSFITLNNLYIKSLDKGIGIFGGLFSVTTFTHSFNIFIFLMSVVILILTAFYPRKVYNSDCFSINALLLNKFMYNKEYISNKNHQIFRIIEYPLIIMFIICGAIFLISTGDLISIFLSIELQSYGLYIISSIYRDSESATASGLTYFLLGGLSSCFILLGSAILYANSGTTNLDNLYIISSISEINVRDISYLFKPYFIYIALIIMCVGLLFKVSAAPFHFWSPDVYDGIPTVVTTYVATIAKISIFAFLLELVYYTSYYYFDFSWKSILLLSSLFSLVIGSILGLTQSRIKRLFAYSTISHVGFILLALSINTTESIQSYIFYILQYSICNLNAFIILICIGFSLYMHVYKEKKYQENLIDIDNSPIQLISQIKGYFYINSFLAISLAITLFSFVGIPPIIGFFAKQMILSAALDNGYTFMTFIAIITSVIAAGYYLNLIKEIFFYKHSYIINSSIDNDKFKGYILDNRSKDINRRKVINFRFNNITINSGISSSISIITLLLILFIYMPEQWFNITNILSLIIFKA